MGKQFYILLLIISFKLFVSRNAEAQGNCLVGNLLLDGNSNDNSPLQISGLDVGEITYTKDRFGKENSAYYFNGEDNYIDLGTSNRGVTNKITVSAWINTNSLDYQWVVGKYYWYLGGYILYTKGGKAYFDGRDNSGEYRTTGPSAVSVNDNKWHLLTGVCDGNKWQIWVDGKLDKEFVANYSYTDLTNYEPLFIGRSTLYRDQPYLNFKGEIDDVKIYNCALTEIEIKKLFEELTSIIHIPLSKEEVVLYPSPTDNFIYLNKNFKEEVKELTIFNSLGTQIFKSNISASIDVSSFAPGLYFVHYFSPSGKKIFEGTFVKN